MDMTLRWFGEGVDSVSLEQIRQIPGVKGVITTLYDIPAGGGLAHGAYSSDEGTGGIQRIKGPGN